jgi:methionyl-tRNA formyltransferase
MTRVVFLGSPGPAVASLRELARGELEVVLVVTQPDRPKGRGKAPAPTPVKLAAKELGIPVATPIDAGSLEEAITATGPIDVGVVVAYGRLLRQEVLEHPRLGMLNVHFSLLPRWRGAAPVARALMAGDTMTGVTIIRLDEGLDTGPVLTAQGVDVRPDENRGELTDRLASVGSRLVTGAIPAYTSGEMHPVKQSDEGLTYASKLEPSDRPLDVSGSATEAINRVRGLSPEPGATLVIDDEVVQILRARLGHTSPEPGTWSVEGNKLLAGLADGGVELVDVKPPGKRAMSGAAWVQGRHRSSGHIA